MHQLPISQFKLLKVQEIKDSPCLELTSDGEHLCYVVIGVQGDMKHRIEGIMSQIDAMRGKRNAGSNRNQGEQQEGDS